MARKSERRKGANGRADSGSKRVAKPAKGAKVAKAAPPPPPAPKVRFRGKLLENEPLSRYNTWRIGGPARYHALPADSEDVVRALEMAQERGLPWVVLGLGSNVLVKDGGFPGVVIRMGKGLDRFEMKGATAIVGAGMPTPILARRTADAGFEGIVLEAKLGLGEESPAKLKELQAKLFRWRKAGTPFDQPCCGSTFINPSGTKTAGMLIDEVGLKGFTIGGAQVSTQHANYIINKGTATATDVLKVIDHIRKTVAKKTGVTLELECKVIGV